MQTNEENSATQQEDGLQNETIEQDQDLQSDLQNELDTPQPEPEYKEQNSELDSFLDEATTTKQQEYQQGVNERKEEKAQSEQITPQDASALAVQGVVQVIKFAQEQTGKNIKIGANQLAIGSSVFVPAIMKYYPMVQKYIKDMAAGIDSNSNLPEYLAGGGAAVLGGFIWLQTKKKPKKNEVPTGEESGD